MSFSQRMTEVAFFTIGRSRIIGHEKIRPSVNYQSQLLNCVTSLGIKSAIRPLRLNEILKLVFYQKLISLAFFKLT